MSDTGPAKISVCSFNNHRGILSEPLALHGFSFDSFLADWLNRHNIGDKKASLMMYARPFWPIPSMMQML